MKILLGFADELATTLVVVTHDPELAKRGDRMLMIKDGRII
jgi:predicted ABC-type transport system involved in lysophospholipase L1 biosynthesis ATPase subunit